MFFPTYSIIWSVWVPIRISSSMLLFYFYLETLLLKQFHSNVLHQKKNNETSNLAVKWAYHCYFLYFTEVWYNSTRWKWINDTFKQEISFFGSMYVLTENRRYTIKPNLFHKQENIFNQRLVKSWDWFPFPPTVNHQ